MLLLIVLLDGDASSTYEFAPVETSTNVGLEGLSGIGIAGSKSITTIFVLAFTRMSGTPSELIWPVYTTYPARLSASAMLAWAAASCAGASDRQARQNIPRLRKAR